jgi:hypothetical protein
MEFVKLVGAELLSPFGGGQREVFPGNSSCIVIILKFYHRRHFVTPPPNLIT